MDSNQTNQTQPVVENSHRSIYVVIGSIAVFFLALILYFDYNTNFTLISFKRVAVDKAHQEFYIATPSGKVAPGALCHRDSDCRIDYKSCTAVSTPSAGPNIPFRKCDGRVICEYGACALMPK